MAGAILRIIYVSLLTIGGGILGIGCLGNFLLASIHGYDHGFGEGEECSIIGSVIGAIAGAGVAAFQLDRNPPDPPPDDRISK